MNLTKLLDHFDQYDKLHIEVNMVRDHVITLGFQDEIRFHFVEMDESLVRGCIYRYCKHGAPYGDPIRCSEICIAKSQQQDWRRLVAVKELLHITDTDKERAATDSAVSELIQRLSLPFDIQMETKASLNDRHHIIPALAVLVPKPCRDQLKPLFKQGKINAVAISQIAQIPDRYVKWVMSDNFDDIISAFKAISG
jgi:hypothetical protein